MPKKPTRADRMRSGGMKKIKSGTGKPFVIPTQKSSPSKKKAK